MSSAWGTPDISNFTRTITAPGFQVEHLYGTPTIYNRNLFVNPPGVVSGEAFGPVQITGEIWYFSVPSLGVVTTFGTSSIDNKNRTVTTVAWNSSQFGLPLCIKDGRYILPDPWTSSFFGNHVARDDVFIAGPSSFSSSAVGQPQVIGPQYVYPLGILNDVFGENSIVWNYNQIVLHINGQIDNEDEFGVGLVLNRNRTLFASGWRSDKISNGAEVVAGAWGITAPSIGAVTTFGTPDFSEGTRYLRPPGLDSFASEKWHVIYNAARVVYAQGWQNNNAFGSFTHELKNRFYDIPPGPDAEYGTPFVAPRVRTLGHWFPSAGDGVSVNVEVRLGTNFIYPSGWEEYRTSATYLYIHKNEAFVWGMPPPDPQVSSDAIVLNRNRSYTITAGFQSEVGQAKIELLKRYLTVIPWISSGVSRELSIADTDRTFSIPSLGAPPVIVTTHKVEYTSITPNVTRTVWPRPLPEYAPGITGYTTYGQPEVRSNSIFPSGIFSQVIGTHQAKPVDQTIFPSGWTIVNDSRFGIAKLNRTQYIILDGEADDDNIETSESAHNGIEPGPVGWPRFNPHTVWARLDTPIQAKLNHPESDDYHILDGFTKWGGLTGDPVYGWRAPSQLYGRPFPWVDHKNRTFTGWGGIEPPFIPVSEGAAVILKRRVVRPGTWRSDRFGVLHEIIPHGNLAQAVGIPPAIVALDFMGEPLYNVTNPVVRFDPIPPPPPPVLGDINQSVVPSGLRVELFNRTVFPGPFVSTFQNWHFVDGEEPYLELPTADTQPPSKGWVFYAGPKIPRQIQGWKSEAIGTAMIAYRIRHVLPDPFDASDMVYRTTRLQDQMRVSNRTPTTHTSNFPPQFIGVSSQTAFAAGVPDIYNRSQFVYPDCMCVHGKGIPDVAHG
jgi:hypothetical protein